jgi:hypothetical protein
VIVMVKKAGAWSALKYPVDQGGEF